MCGICGLVTLTTTSPVDRDLLIRMNGSLEHRGPDEQGSYVSSNAALAMRRLSIIDLQGGHQPVFNETGTACVVLNGEIYNYRDLRATLEELGHRFASQSDTETIVHAYEEWGEGCLKKLRGMFALAVWDAVRSRLLLARDRLGKKPLYYYNDGRRFLFASEIKALLQDTSVPRRLNYRALQAYLTLGYVPSPETMFAGIFKLPAGHALTVSDGQCQIRQYWDLTYRSRNPLDAPTLREELLELLDEAVRLRLVSDVPLGALLSGGIDSSLVVALMSRHVSSPVNTYSVGFSEPTLNELPYARLASERLNTNHHEIAVDTCTPDLLQRLIWHLDEPVADPAAVPTYLVCRLARETVTVVLTGEGGDELFAGYDYYGNRPWHSIRRLLPAGLNRRALPLAAATLNRVLGRKRYHDRTLWFLSLPENLQMIAWVAIFTDEALSTLCVPGLNGSGPSLAHSTFARLYDAHPEADDLQRLTYVDTKMWLPDDLLMKVDKMSMAASVEARCPFLDHHLTEFVANIPSALKRKDGVAKAILKEIAADILPPAIVARSKQTFDVPVGRWLTGSLRDVTLNAISEGIVPGGRFFSDEALRKLWRDVETDVPGAARQLWVLLNLRIWMHEYRVNLM